MSCVTDNLKVKDIEVVETTVSILMQVDAVVMIAWFASPGKKAMPLIVPKPDA
jgi:hypothetical protein